METGNFRHDRILFRAIEQEDIIEIIALHKEWFPIDYPESYFLQMKQKRIIAIGCFYSHQESNSQVILGSILAKVQDQDERNERVFDDLDRTNNNRPGWLDIIRNLFSCRTRRDRFVCYVMTIGVIDEARKLGIGSRLLQAMADCMMLQEPAVEALYLHVVIYNLQALAFYDKNDFKRIGELRDWYEIHGRNYDAVLLYKPIRKPELGIKEAANSEENV